MTRAVLAVAILSGVSYVTTTAVASPDQFGVASDVYATAAETWLAGENPYAVHPPDQAGYYYLYPPITLVLFVLHGLLGPLASYLLQTAANLLVVGALVAVLVRALRRRDVALGRLDVALLAGFVAVSPYGMPHLIEGQVTLWLALALAVGFDALDRDRETIAGVAFAAAAVVKVFPAAVGLWLLRRRRWRAIAAALAVGIGSLALGALLLGPDLTTHYLEEVLLARYERESFERVTDPETSVGGIRRQLAGLFGVPVGLLTPVSLVVLLPLIGFTYRNLETDVRRQAAVLATLVGLLLFMPLQPLYLALLYFPLVMLMYTLGRGPARVLLLVGFLTSLMLVDLEDVRSYAEVLPGGLEAAVREVAEAVFAVVLPPDVGLWLLLAAAVLVHTAWYRSRYPVGMEDPIRDDEDEPPPTQ